VTRIAASRSSLGASPLALISATSYTAVVRGKNDSTGIGLVEFYKLD
jgi:hypothetical protein